MSQGGEVRNIRVFPGQILCPCHGDYAPNDLYL